MSREDDVKKLIHNRERRLQILEEKHIDYMVVKNDRAVNPLEYILDVNEDL